MADCPFCRDRGHDPTGKLVVYLNQDGPFHGYFRCLNRCVPGGFPLWFARLAAIDPTETPGFEPEREYPLQGVDYPVVNLNTEIQRYHDRLTDPLRDEFSASGVSAPVLAELQIGFNGRYIVYPYFQADGNCYAARCVFPDRPQDYFWHGNERFAGEAFQIFNIQDLQCCENGALFLCEGENNLLPLKQLGFPGIAVPHSLNFDSLDPDIFAYVRTLFIVTVHSGEAEMAARALAARIGYKVRLCAGRPLPRAATAQRLAKDRGGNCNVISGMVQSSAPFPPLPGRTHLFRPRPTSGKAPMQTAIKFPRLTALDGIHGINASVAP
jgi:hypothetical protein